MGYIIHNTLNNILTDVNNAVHKGLVVTVYYMLLL